MIRVLVVADVRLHREGVATLLREHTKEARCRDVQEGKADTSFTPDQVAAVEAIRTVDGHQVFAWGGRWDTTKDTMHFQINVTPDELARGIRPDSVRQHQSTDAGGELEDG